MKKTPETVLKIYCLSQPILHTEWASLQGDKYLHALNFQWAITHQFEEAQVIAWDGVITPKLRPFYQQIINKLKAGCILILQGEAQTLLAHHPFVELIKLDQIQHIYLPGWSVLPEEILAVLELCYQKINHV